MRLYRKLICSLFILLVTVPIAACDNNKGDYLNVTFETYGGTEIKPIKVKRGGHARAPAPERIGYRFLGWSSVSSPSPDMVFENGLSDWFVNSDMTFYAAWERLQEYGVFEIIYDSLNGIEGVWLTGLTPEAGLLEEITIPSEIYGLPVQLLGVGIFNKPNIKKVIVSEGITNITDNTFVNCSNLTEISLPATLKRIESYAFSGCVSLDSLDLPDALEYMDWRAFENTGIWNNAPESDIIYLEDWAVGYKGARINTASFREGTVGIISNPFVFNNNEQFITAVDLPKSLKYFCGLGGLTALKNVNAHPDSLYFSSANGVLFDKAKEKLLLYPQGKTETAYTVPGSVKRLGGMGRSKIKTIAIPQNVTVIEEAAFYMSDIETVVIENGVTEIGAMAFAQTPLKNISLGNAIRSIGSAAFHWTALTVVNIPSSVDFIASDAFYNSSVAQINVSADNAYYCDVDDVLMNKGKTVLLYYPNCKTDEEYTIPVGIITLCDRSFTCNAYLKKLTIPPSVNVIGSYQFGATVITEIVLLTDTFGYFHADEGNSISKIYVPADKLQALKSSNAMSAYSDLIVALP